MKKITTAFLLLLLFIFFGRPFVSMASLGVGIGTGKIQIDEELKNGMKYKFPSLAVTNTGDVVSNYTIDISYDQNQKELLPPLEWFTFTPEIFFLEPGETQKVNVELSVPVDKVVPGDYFGYLEAKPVIEGEDGEATVGIAVAAKLNFTIQPSNLIEGIYYRAKDLFIEYQPWTTIISSLVALFTLRAIFRKFFSLDLSIKPRKKENKGISNNV